MGRQQPIQLCLKNPMLRSSGVSWNIQNHPRALSKVKLASSTHQSKLQLISFSPTTLMVNSDSSPQTRWSVVLEYSLPSLVRNLRSRQSMNGPSATYEADRPCSARGGGRNPNPKEETRSAFRVCLSLLSTSA